MNCKGPDAPARDTACTRPPDSLARMPNSRASGEAGLVVLRPHAIAHVLVVHVGGHQVRPVLGQPLLDAGLDRVVEHEDVGEFAAVEQGDGAFHRRQRDDDRAGGRFAGIADHGRLVAIPGCIHAGPQQAVVGGEEARGVASRQARAAHGGRLQFVERGIHLGVRAQGVAIGRQRECRSMALAGGVELAIEHVERDLVDLAAVAQRRLGGRLRRRRRTGHQQQGKDDRQAARDESHGRHDSGQKATRHGTRRTRCGQMQRSCSRRPTTIGLLSRATRRRRERHPDRQERHRRLAARATRTATAWSPAPPAPASR